MNSDYLWIAFVNRDTGWLSGSRIPGYVIARPDNLFYSNSISLYIGRALEKCIADQHSFEDATENVRARLVRDDDPVSRMSDVAQQARSQATPGITLELDRSV